MKNKKFIALALAAIMIAGCGNKKKADTSKAKDTQPKTAQTETANAPTEKTEETTAPQTNSGASEKKPTASSSSTSSSTSRKPETVKATSNKPSTASSSKPSANTFNKPTGSVNKTSSPAKKPTQPSKPSKQTIAKKTSTPAKTQYLVSVPFINQAAEGAPNGCEVASLLQALKGKGQATNVSYHYMLDHMPYTKDGNPYHGFVDSPYNHYKKDCFQSIFPSALVPYGKKFGNVSNTSGYSTDQLINELKNGNPSVVYVTFNFKTPRWKKYHFGNIVDNMHVMTLTGYDTKSGKFRVMDPYKKGSCWVSSSVFKRSYNALKWAITVR